MFKFDNNVLSTLASALGTGATSLVVNAETGINNKPPDPLGGSAALTLVDNLASPTVLEIIYYTGITGTGPYTLTGVKRGQENTADQSWSAGAFVFQSQTEATKTLGAINPAIINNDIYVSDNHNAHLIGPVSIADGVALSVGSGSTLSIV